MIRTYHARTPLFPKHVFRISRASRPRVDNVFFTVEQDGIFGYGEASPNSYFHEDASVVQMNLAGLADYFRRQTLQSADDIARIWNEIWEYVSPSRATQCAVDLALWDLWAKINGRTATETLLGKAAKDVPTSATLGLCPSSEWDERIAEVAAFPAIKVKMDATADLGLLRAIRKQSGAIIRVDANCAWSAVNIGPLSEQLAELGVEFIEQPLPQSEDARMAAVLKQSRLPILADESCAGPDDVAALAGRFSGFNIKLVKCGGITPGLVMLRAGKKLGLKTMIGCMLESSLLISAGAVLAQDSDYADLDGSWLIKNDPFIGLYIIDGKIRTGTGLGLGVKPKDAEEA